jgi:hypothetical protein
MKLVLRFEHSPGREITDNISRVSFVCNLLDNRPVVSASSPDFCAQSRGAPSE